MNDRDAWAELERLCPGVTRTRKLLPGFEFAGEVWFIVGPRGFTGAVHSFDGAGPESVRAWARALALPPPSFKAGTLTEP